MHITSSQHYITNYIINSHHNNHIVPHSCNTKMIIKSRPVLNKSLHSLVVGYASQMLTPFLQLHTSKSHFCVILDQLYTYVWTIVMQQ